MARRWEFWIDRGGTFTDCLGRDPASGEVRVAFAGGGGGSAQRLAYSPDGSLVAATSAAAETPFELHRADTGELAATIGRPGEEPISVCFSPARAEDEFVATVRIEIDRNERIADGVRSATARDRT